MPSNSAGACAPISSVMIAPQSPPCATNFLYPRRFMSTTQARAMCCGIPAGGGRLAREAVAGHRRNHQVERIRCAAAMRGGIGQRVDDLHLLDDRSGPSVRDDERQRVLVLRTDVDEVNVQPVDLGDELRHSVQLRLDLAPVVVRRPIARECLNRGELNALRVIRDRFPLGPPCRLDAPAQFGEIRFRKIHVKRTDGNSVGAHLLCNLSHGVRPF